MLRSPGTVAASDGDGETDSELRSEFVDRSSGPSDAGSLGVVATTGSSNHGLFTPLRLVMFILRLSFFSEPHWFS